MIQKHLEATCTRTKHKTCPTDFLLPNEPEKSWEGKYLTFSCWLKKMPLRAEGKNVRPGIDDLHK